MNQIIISGRDGMSFIYDPFGSDHETSISVPEFCPYHIPGV